MGKIKVTQCGDIEGLKVIMAAMILILIALLAALRIKEKKHHK